MNKFRVIVATLALASASFGLMQAVENYPTTSALTASVGRGRQVTEGRVVPPNHVHLDLRHCQKYQRADLTIDVNACEVDASTLFDTRDTHNLRTNAGADWQADLMGKNSAPTVNTQCQYLGAANDTSNTNVGTVAAADTAINTSGTGSTEITTNGFNNGGSTRWAYTYAHSASATSYTETKVISATGTQASNKVGLFSATSTGTMCFEALYTQATVNNGDTLTVTWTINF